METCSILNISPTGCSWGTISLNEWSLVTSVVSKVAHTLSAHEEGGREGLSQYPLRITCSIHSHILCATACLSKHHCRALTASDPTHSTAG